MKIKLSTYLRSILFLAFGLAFLLSATIPKFSTFELISIVEIELVDLDSQEEEHNLSIDDKDGLVNRFMSLGSTLGDMLDEKLSFIGKVTRNVHLDIITPPPDCC